MNLFHNLSKATSYTTSYSHSTQPFQRRHQNPPLTHISADPLYQMNQHINYNSNPNPLPINTTQPVAPPPTQSVATPLQYIPIQHDTFMNMSASIPEPMKLIDGLDHSLYSRKIFTLSRSKNNLRHR